MSSAAIQKTPSVFLVMPHAFSGEAGSRVTRKWVGIMCSRSNPDLSWELGLILAAAPWIPGPSKPAPLSFRRSTPWTSLPTGRSTPRQMQTRVATRRVSGSHPQKPGDMCARMKQRCFSTFAYAGFNVYTCPVPPMTARKLEFNESVQWVV